MTFKKILVLWIEIRKMVCSDVYNTSLDTFQRIPLLKLSFTMKFHIHDGKYIPITCQEKNTLMVLLYSSLANSSGSSSLTAAIISSI